MWKYCEKNLPGVQKCEITVWKPKECTEKREGVNEILRKNVKKWERNEK